MAGLVGATERTRLVRMMLEGAGTLPFALGGVLTPTVEAGLRYDTGDAETGAGLVRHAPVDAAQAYQLEVRYGLDGRQGRARWAPYIGVESGGGSRQALRLGVTLTAGRRLDAGLKLGQRQGAPGAPWRSAPHSCAPRCAGARREGGRGDRVETARRPTPGQGEPAWPRRRHPPCRAAEE